MTGLESRVRRSATSGLVKRPDIPAQPKPRKERVLAPCGTYGGYQRHLKTKTTPCEACRKASREYIRRYRFQLGQGTPKYRALLRLAARHPDEYRDLLREETARSEST
jgi:hypothetical protein